MHNHISLKRNLLISLIVVILSLKLLSGCGTYLYPSPAYLVGIIVLPSTMDLEVGESQYINSVTAYYSDSSTANIPLSYCTYYSYNPSCINVNSSGLITGVSTGSTTIMVVYTEGTVIKTDTIIVTVTAVITPVVLTSIEVLPSSMNLNVGETQTISSVTAFYDNSSSANINLAACNYSSSNPACSTVNNSGTISRISEGTAAITVSYNDEVINVFSHAEYKRLLTTNQYIVLTSCHSSQECMELSPVTPDDFDPFGVFTMALCAGCGYYGSYPADTNMDTMVSLQEAYLYVKSYVAELDAQLPYISITPDVQVYPSNSSFAIVEY